MSDAELMALSSDMDIVNEDDEFLDEPSDDGDIYGGEWEGWQSQFDDDPSPYSGTYSEM